MTEVAFFVLEAENIQLNECIAKLYFITKPGRFDCTVWGFKFLK